MVRELHQIPEDYYRITPYGFKFLLKKENLKILKLNLRRSFYCDNILLGSIFTIPTKKPSD